MTPLAADGVVSTAAERASLDALRKAAGAIDTPMERHCLRVFLIVERMATDNSIDIDREVALCASYLFEIGIYPLASTRDVYTSDGRRFAKLLLEPFGWPEARLRLSTRSSATISFGRNGGMERRSSSSDAPTSLTLSPRSSASACRTHGSLTSSAGSRATGFTPRSCPG